MAGLEHLIPYIYHEKQQKGSMLCAQHALNSLLQDNYFAASDLSDIARGLDVLEESYDYSNTGSSSTNMDDTGFFSVQVLDKALKVWGLNLTRWRSQDLHSYHDKPQTQLGFILNLQQHWFALRRFGNASANIDQDEGNGHWFNLNSFLPRPEWVGKLYLGMVLQQAEAEGYSVFAVIQADPNLPLALPRTEADMIASTLLEPTSVSATHPERSLGTNFEEPRPREPSSNHDEGLEGFEDEDYQLQAALQASLMDDNLDQPSFLPSQYIPTLQPAMLTNSSPPGSAGSGSGSCTPQLTQHIGGSMPLPGHADVDPVVASAERNKVLLQRMKEEQEYAQREVWSGADLTSEEQTALQARREQRQREEQKEAEALRRAIEESKALSQRSQLEAGEGIEIDDESRDMNGESSHTSPGFVDGNRVYDDDDAELQAALKASLEHMPSDSPNHPPSQRPLSPSDVEDTKSIVSDTTAAEETSSEITPAVSLDEIRKRRLARFGAS